MSRTTILGSIRPLAFITNRKFDLLPALALLLAAHTAPVCAQQTPVLLPTEATQHTAQEAVPSEVAEPANAKEATVFLAVGAVEGPALATAKAAAQQAPAGLTAAPKQDSVSATLNAESSFSGGFGRIETSLKSRAITSAPKPYTTFPTTFVGVGASSTVTFSTTFSSATTVTGGGVYTLGATGSDFQDLGTGSCDTNGYPYTYAASSSCTTVVSFTPSKAGNRQGAEVLYTSTAGSYYYGFLNGIGSGPDVTFSPATPTISTLASGLSAYGTALDGANDLWVTDSVAGTVKEFVPTNGVYPTSPTNTFTGFTSPQGIAIDGIGNVYVGDGAKGYVWRLSINSSGVIAPGTAPVAYASFLTPGTQPIYVAFDPTQAYLYFTGIYNSSKYLIYCTLSSGSCGLVTTFTAPSGFAVDSAGYRYISESSLGTVVRLPVAYNSSTKTTLLSGLTLPSGLTTDAAGDLYVAAQGAGTSGAGTVTEYLASAGLVSSSSTTRTLATGLYAPSGLAVSSAGNLFIADTSNTAVKFIDYADTPSLSFPVTVLGGTSASQTVTLQNIGNADLTFPIPSSGGNASVSSGFILSNTSTCPILTSSSSAGTLSQGATCTYVAAYQPTSSGPTTGRIAVTDNKLAASSATQMIRVGGSTTAGLLVNVVAATIPRGTTSFTFSFDVGYGGTTPTGATTLKVNGSTAGTSTTCAAKLNHIHCEVGYNPSSLAPGQYTLIGTQVGDSTYATTTGTAVLTIY